MLSAIPNIIGTAINGVSAAFDPNVDLIPNFGPNSSSPASRDYQNQNEKKESYRANGVVYNYAGNPIGSYDQQQTANTGNKNPNTPSSTYTPPNYAQQNANALSQLAQSGNVIQNSINRLPGQLDIALGNIDTQYGQRKNELQSQYDQNQNNYNTSTTQNQQNFRSNKNTINDQASSGLRGLMRMLGSYGAVGSDMGLAGQAVSDVASQQNAGAGQTFAQNQSGLDTNWGNYKNSWENEDKNVNDWRTAQRNSASAQSATVRQDLLGKLADIRGQEAAARGGSYASSAQPYLDQANALSGQIDALGRLNPTYTGTTPVYQAAPLSSYSTGNGATLGGQQPITAGSDTPWLNLVLGRDKKQNTLGY